MEKNKLSIYPEFHGEHDFWNRLKFKGIIKPSEYPQELSQEAINLFLEKNVITEYISPPSNFSWTDPDYKAEETIQTNFEIDFFDFKYNKKTYTINNNILKEIYELLNYKILFVCDPYSFKIGDIERKLESLYDNKKKIKYLNRMYSKVFPKSEEFAIYNGERIQFPSEIMSIRTWEEFIFLQIELTPEIIKLYLTAPLEHPFDYTLSKSNLLNEIDFIDDWVFNYNSKSVLDYIKSQLILLEKNKTSRNPSETTLVGLLGEKKYSNLITDLIDNNWAIKNGDELIFKLPDEHINLSFKTSFAALSVKILTTFNINGVNDTELAKAMNKAFCNLNITSKNIGDFKIAMNTPYKRYDSFKYTSPPTRREVFYEPFSFINC